MPSPAISEAGKKKKETMVDFIEKAEGKRKKDKKEVEKEDKFCKPGEEMGSHTHD